MKQQHAPLYVDMDHGPVYSNVSMKHSNAAVDVVVVPQEVINDSDMPDTTVVLFRMIKLPMSEKTL